MSLELEIDEREVIDTGKQDDQKNHGRINRPAWQPLETATPPVEAVIEQNQITNYKYREEGPRFTINMKIIHDVKIMSNGTQNSSYLMNIGSSKKYPDERDDEKGLHHQHHTHYTGKSFSLAVVPFCHPID